LWHNRECFRTKPRKIITLERDFGCDIVEILKETTRKCGNVKAQCNLLDVSIPYLYQIIRKYCCKSGTASEVEEFMAKNSSGKRKELYAKKVKRKVP
jgi:hypothetical protein